MDNLFLSREVGSIETGPQIFAGTNVLNTSFIFSSTPVIPEEPGLFNSVLLQNAGLNQLNGTYIYVTEFEGKPYYYKSENPSLFILWFENQWEIYDFDLDVLPIYIGNENVLYPWNITLWQSPNPIYEPVPTVTKVL
jgi:hypothetical protein